MTTDVESKIEMAVAQIDKELAAAASQLHPISRRRLVGIISRKFDILYHEAEQIVDDYCEAKAPGTPEFLGNEWFLPYVKLMALILAIIGVVLVGVGAELWYNHSVSWPFFILGAAAIGFGGAGVVKALRGEKEQAEDEAAFPEVD